MELALVPSKVSYKDVVSGASLKELALGSKASNTLPSILKRKPETKTLAKGMRDKPTEAVTPQQEEPREEPIDTSPVRGIWYPRVPSHAMPSSPWHSSAEPSRQLPLDSEEGYKSDHPFYVDTPYRLPSGVEVTENSISRPVHSLAADMLKNCILRADLLEMKLKSEAERAALDSKKFKAELRETRSLLEDCLAEKESLSSRLVSAETSAASAVEDFKESREYIDLLKGNTITLLKDFCQKVSEFPGISSHFQEYVSGLGDEYIVDLFDDLPDDEDMGADDEDSEASHD
ncbi:hypothetical protein LIER_03863 [Lithospermum erythrorhizon]|uniref:Uncharacterized protein n=1 Tax=Lithospermum erythrorhizon TaxID=34254 RepID=A0AAV3NV34_LITER